MSGNFDPFAEPVVDVDALASEIGRIGTDAGAIVLAESLAPYIESLVRKATPSADEVVFSPHWPQGLFTVPAGQHGTAKQLAGKGLILLRERDASVVRLTEVACIPAVALKRPQSRRAAG